MLNLMLSNEMLLQKLEKGIKKVHLHHELRNVVFGRMHILNKGDIADLRWSAFDVKKFLRCLDLQDNEITDIL